MQRSVLPPAHNNLQLRLASKKDLCSDSKLDCSDLIIDNMKEIALDTLTEIEEIQSILAMYKEAKEYLNSFDWCISTKQCWYDKDHFIPGAIGVFLFEIEPINSKVDDFIWIIVGDLPSVYLDKSVTTGKEALENYCELMQEWADNVISGRSLDECYPVPVEPTTENADLLISRISFLRRELLMIKDE